MNSRAGDLRESGNGITMDALVQFLSQSVDRMVVNRTGLSGTFEFTIEFAPDTGPGAQPAADSGASDAQVPSIFTALQEQLGLKLESTTGPVEVLVIDHVEEPTPN